MKDARKAAATAAFGHAALLRLMDTRIRAKEALRAQRGYDSAAADDACEALLTQLWAQAAKGEG